MNDKQLTIIGRAERVDLPDLKLTQVPAKVDTGADVSAIWASDIKETAKGLQCVFFGQGSEFYSGNIQTFPKSSYTITRVANSFGQKEIRYKLKLRVRINGRLVRATFTLSDRSIKTYPILLGRRLLAGKFLVDVQKGKPLSKQEKQRKVKLQKDLQNIEREQS